MIDSSIKQILHDVPELHSSHVIEKHSKFPSGFLCNSFVQPERKESFCFSKQ